MKYIDGFLLVVPTKKLGEYKRIAKIAGRVWKKCGALEYRECTGDDMKTSMGMPFARRAGAKKGETVVFSWIGYKSRAHRDAVNKKVMADKRMAEMCGTPMPFDMKRMSYAGFSVLVDA